MKKSSLVSFRKLPFHFHLVFLSCSVTLYKKTKGTFMCIFTYTTYIQLELIVIFFGLFGNTFFHFFPTSFNYYVLR